MGWSTVDVGGADLMAMGAGAGRSVVFVFVLVEGGFGTGLGVEVMPGIAGAVLFGIGRLVLEPFDEEVEARCEEGA